MELYQVRHLEFAYPDCGMSAQRGYVDGKNKTVLHDCSFQVEEGSFVTLCGGTGSGKTTLLRLLKKELQPAGTMGGMVCYRGRQLEEYAYGEMAAEIGFVMQNPDEQPVTDKVWHELAFGMENMGVPSEEIRRRTAEISAYFGIDDWYEKAVDELSGGQKQLLNLAAVMVMRPRVLLLDEPTAQLDPIASQNFMNILVRLNRELGMTILLAEHRLEEALSVSDRVMVLEDGILLHDGTPQQISRSVKETEQTYESLPCPVRLYRAMTGETEKSEAEAGQERQAAVPLTITQGRQWLRARYQGLQGEYLQTGNTGKEYPADESGHREKPEKPVLECRHIWFHYKKACDILCDVSLQIMKGEIVSLLGSNGSGKTTLLNVLAGVLRPEGGRVKVQTERVSYLPQQIETLFAADTVEEELRLVGAQPSARLMKYRYVHPFDLSGGEKQLLAWEKVLACSPGLLLLDEPTKGLDASARKEIGARLRTLAQTGVSVLMVTHDIELAAAVSSRCGMLFQGELSALSNTRDFFRGNRFYTTAAARLAQDLFPDILTEEELAAQCRILDMQGKCRDDHMELKSGQQKSHRGRK